MKIKPEHVKQLQKIVESQVLKRGGMDEVVYAYEHGLFPRSDKTKDLQMRFSFDLTYNRDCMEFISSIIYPYANDDHLFTALKSFLPKLTKRY